MALTLKPIVREVLLVWMIETDQLNSRYAYLLDSAIGCVNTAMQLMWASGEDYFCRATLPITLTPGAAAYALPDYVQNTVGPCRFQADRLTLRRLISRGDFDNYGIHFLGKNTNTLSQSRPQAYWIEQLNQTGADPAKVTLHVTPTPASTETIDLDAIIEAPSYVRSNYCSNVTVPVPHKYVESVLLPLARYEAVRSYFASQTPSQQAALPVLKEQADRALMLLGLLRPQREPNHRPSPIPSTAVPAPAAAPGGGG